MATSERTTVVGVFSDYRRAQGAIEALRQAGFHDDQLGFITKNRVTDDSGEALTDRGEVGEGAAAGGLTGGVVGGLLGAAAALLIPGVGPVIAGGVLGATIGGAVIGAAAGGLIGVLTNMGLPEDEARYYNQELESGRTLITVQANGDRQHQDALGILRSYGAYDASTRTAPVGSVDTPSTTYPTDSSEPLSTNNTIHSDPVQLETPIIPSTSTTPIETTDSNVRRDPLLPDERI